MKSSQSNFLPLLIVLIALLLRLLHLFSVAHAPFFDTPYLDAGAFDQKALLFAEGQPFDDRAYFQAPFYIYFLGTIYKLFGHSYWAATLIQVLLSTATVWLTYLLAKRLYNRSTALLAALILAFYGPLIHYSSQLLITTLFVFWVALFLLLLDKAREQQKFRDYLLLGVIFGLAAITRPNILIFAPIALLYLLLRSRDKIKRAVLFLAGALLIILPVTIRNYIVEKDLVLISSQAGVNFYMGNNPWATGRTAWVPGTSRDWWNEGFQQTIEIAERTEGSALKSSDISAFWFNKAISEMSVRPAKWLNVYLDKIKYLLSGYEISDTEDIYFYRQFSWILALLMWTGWFSFPMGILLPLALFGLAFNFDWKSQWHLILFQLVFAIGLMLFVITSRYRLPMAPLWAIWAAAGSISIINLCRQGKILHHFLTILGFVLLLVVVNRNPVQGGVIPMFDGTINLGNTYLEKKDYPNALKQFQQAAQLNSFSARPFSGAGIALLNLGRIDEAKEQFLKAFNFDPIHVQTNNNLGQLYLREGNLDQALRHFSISLQQDSTQIFALKGAADTYLQMQDYEAAAGFYQRAYQAGAADKQLLSRWAQAMVAQQRYPEALEVNTLLLKSYPDDPRVHHNQARIYIYCDSLQRAAEELEIVLTLSPNTIDAQQQLRDIRDILAEESGR
ncbi:glycosyltransferase family 39 protein [bacterium]|nr:glycosyltransferase family 39 protein [bacterium]